MTWASGDSLNSYNLNNTRPSWASNLTAGSDFSQSLVTVGRLYSYGTVSLGSWQHIEAGGTIMLSHDTGFISIGDSVGGSLIPQIVFGNTAYYRFGVGGILPTGSANQELGNGPGGANFRRLYQSGATLSIMTSGSSITGGSAGSTGDIKWGPASGVTYLYVCTSTNSWSRVALSPF